MILTIKRTLIALVAAASLVACQDAPYIPAGELYMRSFIKEFGLIPPDREWNLAKQMSVTVTPSGQAKSVQVYVLCGEEYYRVALYCEVEGQTVIPFDAPSGTTSVLVDIDGAQYLTTPGGSVAPSRSSRDGAIDYVLKVVVNGNGTNSWEPNLNIVLASEALKMNTPYLLTGKVMATTAKSLSVTTNTSSYDHWAHTGQTINATTGWIEFSISIQRSDINYNVIQVYLNESKTANTYYFDDLCLVGPESASNLLTNGDFQTESGNVNVYTGTDNAYATVSRVDNSSISPAKPADDKDYPTTTPISLGPNLAWLVCCEDLGATDDIDFNDVIFRLEYLSTNLTMTSNNWNVVENEYELDLGQYPLVSVSAPMRPSRSEGDQEFITLTPANSRDGKIQFLAGGVKITAMAAGGTLPSWLHYYNSATGIDYVIGRNYADDTYELHTTEAYEWHYWFSNTPHMCDYFSGCTDDTHIMMNTDTEYWSDGTTLAAIAHDNPNNIDGPKYKYSIPSDPATTNFGHVTGVLPAEVMNDFHMSEFSDVAVTGDYKKAQINGGFYIAVGEMVSSTSSSMTIDQNTVLLEGDYNVIGLSEMGKAPQMFMIPDVGSSGNGWAWPSERADIRLVYPSFKAWVTSGDVYWYTQAPTKITNRYPSSGLDGDSDFHGTIGFIDRSLFQTR